MGPPKPLYLLSLQKDIYLYSTRRDLERKLSAQSKKERKEPTRHEKFIYACGTGTGNCFSRTIYTKLFSFPFFFSKDSPHLIWHLLSKYSNLYIFFWEKNKRKLNDGRPLCVFGSWLVRNVLDCTEDVV